MTRQEREEAGQEDRQREGVAETRPGQQEHGPQAEPRGDPKRAGEVPEPEQHPVPAGSRPKHLGQSGHPEHGNADGPRELVGTATPQPLVDEKDREEARQQRGKERQEQGSAHAIAPGSVVMTGRSSGTGAQAAGMNSWSSRWLPSHNPQRTRPPAGIATGRMISRTSERRHHR